MKRGVRRYYEMYDQVCSFENLLRAEHNAARGKRKRPDIAAFEYDLEGELLRLRDELRAKTYQPGPYRHYTIREPKERRISAAPFRDRVVHHALCRVIEPIFERRFIPDSYASRAGKGTHAALDRCTQLMRRHCYVLRCDIVQFFPSIDHAILLRQLGRVIGDQDVLDLCARILANGADEAPEGFNPLLFPGDDLWALARPRGLPLGNQTSQFWANVYLNALDQYVKRELHCEGYIRYVDDFLLFSPSKAQLHRWKNDLIAFLGRELRLTLHEAECVVTPTPAGIPFLGFQVYPDYRRLRRRNVVAFTRRYRAQRAAYTAGTLTFERLTAAVQGWVAHAQHANTYHLREKLLCERLISPQLAHYRALRIAQLRARLQMQNKAVANGRV